MSRSALLRGTRTAIRTALSLGQDECDVQKGPEPPPRAGVVFISVHPGKWTRHPEHLLQGGYHSDHLHQIFLTVSLKTSHIPKDRWGEEFAAAASSDILAFEWICEKLVDVVEGSYSLLTAVNDLITTDSGKFIEPLMMIDGGVPEEKRASWWGAKDNAAAASQGLAATMLFSGARRIREIEELGP